MANVFSTFLDLYYCVGVQYSMLEATIENTSRTALQAILAHFWLALPARLPMFLSLQLPDAYHAAPRWKGLESMIKMIYNTLLIGFDKGEL